MLKRALLVGIICLQFVRLASALASFDVVDLGGTAVNFIAAVSLVDHSLRDQLNPVKTLLNVSKHMADTTAPVAPAKNDSRQQPLETSLIVSPTPELVKSDTPISTGAGVIALLVTYIVLLLIRNHPEGMVICRIRHLFSRAREGICAFAAGNYCLFTISPLIRLRVNGDFLSQGVDLA